MLTIALEKVDFLPATRVTDDTSILTLKNLVFEPLLRWVAGGQVYPALFSHWTHSADGRRWEFFIRRGAVFHDGVPCAPDHIVAFIGAILTSVDMFGMKWSYSRYLADATISAGSAHSIVVENPTPFADILDIFSEFYISRSDSAGQPILGTGPYRVTDFTPGVAASLSGPRTILALAEASASERYRMLKTGVVDASLNLERLDDRPDFNTAFQWGRATNTLSVMYYLNCSQGVFADPRARLAANLAVDRQRLIADIFGGLAQEATTIVSPFHLGMRAPPPAIDYDPAAARHLLDAIGGARSVTLRTPLHMPERAPLVSQFVAAALEAVGFAVTMQTETDRPEYARQIGRKDVGDMAIFDSSPQSTFRVLDDKISSRNKAVWWQGYDDAEAETLIRDANATIHADAREAAYSACLHRLNANPAWLYLLHPVDIFAANRHITGLGIDHKGTLTIQ